MKYQLFGSITSQDYDVMVFVDTIPDSKEECKAICESFNIQLSEILSDRELNCNIGILEDGVITKVFKGTTDEVNNSMFLTYKNFAQPYPNSIDRLVPRDTDLKILRAFRIILSMLSRTEHRGLVKAALRGDLHDKILVLRGVDFGDTIETGNKNITQENFYKVISFQIGQVLGFRDDVELYSKEDIASMYPKLSSFVHRDVDNYDYDSLQIMIDELIDYAVTKKHLFTKNENNY